MRKLLPILAAILVSVFALSVATAQDEPKAAHSQPSSHGAGHGGAPGQGGEEQGVGSMFGWALDLAIWTMVVFLILLWVLSKYAWKPMLEGLQRREESIRSALDEAQRAREEAKVLQQRFEKEMNEAQERVRDVMDQARRDAQSMRDDMVAKAKSEIQTERERLHREIEMARDQALEQIWDQSARLATLISAKAIRRQLNAEDHRRLVDEAIAELRQARDQ
jgi:F-type H+-transporting ATPase subunit b